MNLTNINELHALLKRHGFRFDKSKGQNFLVADWVPEEIVAAAGVTQEQLVLEIGPGVGCLTQKLCAAAGRVVAVELDKRLPEILDETLAQFSNVSVLSGDVMTLDLAQAIAPVGALTPVVCANLPYQITTPVLAKLIDSRLFTRLTVMMQREVALRICAHAGTSDYGAFSLYCQYYTEPEIHFDVPPDCFLPAPKVTSSVISLTLRAQPPVQAADERLMFGVIKAAFGQRRKTLQNALSAVYGDRLSKDRLGALIAESGLPASVRGERLALEDFCTLSNRMYAAMQEV